MSHSNISSTAYPVVKYSRSYSLPSGLVGAEEWQHFVNPIIRLVLDVKKSTTGDLESFRLRVLWSLDSGGEAVRTDKQDVTFEDVDLLVFSSLAPHASSPQGLPLKAVYRDAVVGVRYLHPHVFPPGTIATYRRFQVTFQTAASASTFIDSIRLVCPCKQNPAPAPGRTLVKASTMAPPSSHSLARAPTQIEEFSQTQANVSTPVRHTSGLRTSATMMTSPWNAGYDDALTRPSLVVPPAPPPTASTPVQKPKAPSRHAKGGKTDKSAVAPARSSSSVPFASDTNLISPSRPSSAMANYSAMSMPPPEQPTADQRYSSSLPRSSSPNSLVSSDQSSLTGKAPLAAPSGPVRPPLAPALDVFASLHHEVDSTARTRTDTQTEGMLTMLEGESTVYGLSRNQLEVLVAKVVREEGFTKLLEDLDTMWRVKGLIKGPA